jgi:hypothetical protein
VTIGRLVDIVEEIADVQLERRYNLSAPQGVRGRNSDNALVRERLGWEADNLPRRGWRRPTAGATTRSRSSTAARPQPVALRGTS